MKSFEGNDRVRKLSGCGHVYHKKCIDDWITASNRCACPMDGQPIRTEQETLHLPALKKPNGKKREEIAVEDSLKPSFDDLLLTSKCLPSSSTSLMPVKVDSVPLRLKKKSAKRKVITVQKEKKSLLIEDLLIALSIHKPNVE